MYALAPHLIGASAHGIVEHVDRRAKLGVEDGFKIFVTVWQDLSPQILHLPRYVQRLPCLPRDRILPLLP